MPEWMVIGLALVVVATSVLVLNRFLAARRSDDSEK